MGKSRAKFQLFARLFGYRVLEVRHFMIPITYRGFYDKPLAFVAEYKNIQFLFWRDFDEASDEYESAFRVFVMPRIYEKELDLLHKTKSD